MFKKSDKRRLYWLMDQYLSEKINGWTFCNEYYNSYDLEIDYNTLSSLEYSAFSELSRVSGRFSEFEEDHIKYPKAFYTEDELRKKIIETKEILKNEILI